METGLTIAAGLAFAALAAFASWRAGRPWDDARPPLLPWRFIIILSVFALLLALVHLLNLFGVETGRENTLRGRL